MTERKWHSGPPPSIGWWPASTMRNNDILRWWNGEFWSRSTKVGCTAWAAARNAQIKALDGFYVEWTERPDSWPARSKT